MQVLEDWRYISMVIDRLQLYVFLAVTMVGTASILVGAPHIFDSIDQDDITHPFTHTHLTALCPGLPRSAGTRKAKPFRILLKQETVSGSGIS